MPPAATTDAGTVAAQIAARGNDLDVLHCLGRGWELLKNNFGLITAATLLVWTFDLALMVVPFGNLFLSGVLYGGLFLGILHRMRGGTPSGAGGFFGVSRGFTSLLCPRFPSRALRFL